jgi:hypothetical protein
LYPVHPQNTIEVKKEAILYQQIRISNQDQYFYCGIFWEGREEN